MLNGADVLEFAKLEPKIFHALVNEVHSSFRFLESLRIPTIASVQGMAVRRWVRLALACDFLVVEASATLFSVEVMGGMLPGAGGIQRIADRLGRARTIRMIMLAEPISGEQAAALGIATHVVSSGDLQKATADLALKLSTGPTHAYAAIKGLMKAWSPGVAAADLLLSDLSADLYESKDAAAAWKEAEELALADILCPASPSRQVSISEESIMNSGVCGKNYEWFDSVGFTVDRVALRRDPDVAFHDFSPTRNRRLGIREPQSGDTGDRNPTHPVEDAPAASRSLLQKVIQSSSTGRSLNLRRPREQMDHRSDFHTFLAQSHDVLCH